MMIATTILAIVESFLATLAYAVLFNVPKQYYTACGITGMAGWLLYLAMCQVTTVALASFVGTLAVVLISRIFTVRKNARLRYFWFLELFHLFREPEYIIQHITL